MDYRQEDWTDWLPIAQFAINNRPNASTGESPFFMNHGRHPHFPNVSSAKPHHENVGQFAARLRQSHKQAENALHQALGKSARSFNAKAHPALRFQSGDLVYLEATNLRTSRSSAKLAQCRFGPFRVNQAVGETSYQLELPPSWRLKLPVFHQNLLTLHFPPVTSQQSAIPRSPPPTLDEEGEPVYNVEAIVTS